MKKFMAGLSEEQVNKIYEAVEGLTKVQWGLISSRIDLLFQNEAAKVQLGSNESSVEVFRSFLK